MSKISIKLDYIVVVSLLKGIKNLIEKLEQVLDEAVLKRDD